MKRIISFIKKEILHLTGILTNKEKLDNPFIAFKYILYIPLALIISSFLIVLLLLCGFVKGVWSYER